MLLNAMGETLFKDSVAILGAGPIGLLFSQLAKRAGLATYVIEPLPHRREAAEVLGPTKLLTLPLSLSHTSEI